MNDLFAALNGLMCTVFVLLLVAAIVHPCVQDGVVIKVGMIFMAAGFLALASHAFDLAQPGGMLDIERALLLTNTGALVVGLGWLRRTRLARHKARRRSDWVRP